MTLLKKNDLVEYELFFVLDYPSHHQKKCNEQQKENREKEQDFVGRGKNQEREKVGKMMRFERQQSSHYEKCEWVLGIVLAHCTAHSHQDDTSPLCCTHDFSFSFFFYCLFISLV